MNGNTFLKMGRMFYIGAKVRDGAMLFMDSALSISEKVQRQKMSSLNSVCR